VTDGSTGRARTLVALTLSVVILASVAASTAATAVGGPSPQQLSQEATTAATSTEGKQASHDNTTSGSGSVTAASTFDTDDEGWRITGDAQGDGTAPDYLDSGGNPGGHICADDNVAGGTWYFSAPATFLGDRTAAYGGTLAFDIKQSSTDEQFAQDDIVLRNGTTTIVYDFGNATAHPGTDWTAYSVSLDAADPGWTYDSGGDVSPAALRTILGNLTSLSIRGEYVSGSDRGCLDNVRLTESSSSTTFDVTVDATNSPVTEGETLTVDATVKNTGDETAAQDVALSVGKVETDSSQVSLQPGQHRTVSLSWTTSPGDAGNYRVSVSSASDSDSTAVAVQEQGASVTVDDQQVADTSVQEVVVGSASLPSSGFLVVYNASVGTSPAPSSAIGVSGLLGPGGHENVRVDLDERIAGSETLTVVVHSDTDGDNVYDGAGIDTPFTVNGVPVNDTASITMRSSTSPSTATSTPAPTPTATATATPSPAAPPTSEGTSRPETTGEGTPGFGVGAAILAVITAVLLARRD
jgi:PGF-CTERM protein